MGVGKGLRQNKHAFTIVFSIVLMKLKLIHRANVMAAILDFFVSFYKTGARDLQRMELSHTWWFCLNLQLF